MVDLVQRNANLPETLKEALEKGCEIFEEVEHNKFSLRFDRQIAKKYLDCDTNSDGYACGETLCFNGRKKIYVCTNGICYLRGYYEDC